MKKLVTMLSLALAISFAGGCGEKEKKPEPANEQEDKKEDKKEDKIKAGDACNLEKDEDFCDKNTLYACTESKTKTVWEVSNCAKEQQGSVCITRTTQARRTVSCGIPCNNGDEPVEQCFDKNFTGLNFDAYFPWLCIKADDDKYYYQTSKIEACDHGCDQIKNTCLLLDSEEGQLCNPLTYKKRCVGDNQIAECWTPDDNEFLGKYSYVKVNTCPINNLCREIAYDGFSDVICTPDVLSSCDAASDLTAACDLSAVAQGGLSRLSQRVCAKTDKDDFAIINISAPCGDCNTDTLNCTVDPAELGDALSEGAACHPEFFVMRCDGNDQVYCSSLTKKVVKETCAKDTTCGTFHTKEARNTAGVYVDCFAKDTCTEDLYKCEFDSSTGNYMSLLFPCINRINNSKALMSSIISYEICFGGCDENNAHCL